MNADSYSYAEVVRKMKKATHRVAILSSISSGMQGEAMYGFRRYNELAEQPFKVYPYFALSPDPLHVEITARRILERDYDLVFCIGALATTVLHRLTKEMDTPPPVLFCFTSNPVERGFIKSMSSSGNNMVGIEHASTFLQGSIDAFIKMHDKAKSVLIPCDDFMPANRHLDKARTLTTTWIDTMVKQFQTAGISVEAVGFRDPEGTLDYIEKNACQFDTVFIPSSTYAINIHAAIGHYAELGGAALVANLRTAVRCSAAYGYSESFIRTGIQVAKYAQDILFKGVAPADLATRRLTDKRTIMVNCEIAKMQGLDPDELIERAGDGVVIFDKRAPFPAQYVQDYQACLED